MTSCEKGTGAWRLQEETLRSLWEKSTQQHSLVEAPDEADIVVVVDIRPDNQHVALRRLSWIGRFPEKCFAVSDMAKWPLLPLLHGVYVNAGRSLHFASRYRTGAYGLFHPDFKNPLVEGHPGHAYERPKRYLGSFLGRNCHPVREAMLQAGGSWADILLRDTSTFNTFTHDPTSAKQPAHAQFMDALLDSKFSLCPRGDGPASIRLFESMKLGVAPVILSDDWIPPRGPDWASFSLRVPEADATRVDSVLAANEGRHREMGRLAQQAYEAHFAPEAYFDYLIDQLDSIRREQRFPERLIWHSRDLLTLGAKVSGRLRGWLPTSARPSSQGRVEPTRLPG